MAKGLGEWIVKMGCSRLQVKAPTVHRSSKSQTYFETPDKIYIQAKYYEYITPLLNVCAHELAHYLHYHNTDKAKYNKLTNLERHGVEWFEWLLLTSKAMFNTERAPWLYCWESEHRRTQKEAIKRGYWKNDSKA